MAVSPLMPPLNAMCDIYRFGNAPPAPPDVAGVHCRILPRFGNIKPTVAFTYTHIFYFTLDTDVRDRWPGAINGDSLYVPDHNGPAFFSIAFVERVRIDRGGGRDYLRAYVNLSDAFSGAATEL